MAAYGIDVSKHNGTIDWSKASKKVSFAILRAGYGSDYSQVDAQFENNYNGCKNNNVPIGAYWYCYATTTSGAQHEALVCAEVINGKSFELPIFYDVEEKSVLALGKTKVSEIARTFLTTLKKAGVNVGIYSMVSALNSYFDDDILTSYDVWCAHVGVSQPSYSGDYAIWQFSWTGTIDGITEKVDQNYCYKEYSGVSTATDISSNLVGNATDVAAALTSIDYTQFTPYIATITRSTTATDLSELKNIGVIGVLIESGYLYDASHIETTYKNPKLTEQVQMATDADLYFGFYHVIKARSVEEAKKELSALQTCIQRYNPTMGVWLKPPSNNSKTKNDEIIEVYYNHLVKLGLENKIGFYATKDELETFDWEGICDKWYLWLNDHVSDISEIDTLLEPEFFMTGYDSSEPLEDTVSIVNTTSAVSSDTTTAGEYMGTYEATWYTAVAMGYSSAPKGASGRTLVSGYSVASNSIPSGTLIKVVGTDIDGTYRVDDTGGMTDNVIDFYYFQKSEVPSSFRNSGRISIEVYSANELQDTTGDDVETV